MKKQDIILQKTIIILIYILLLIDVMAIIITQWDGVINNIFFPFIIFVVLTLIQTFLFHIVKNEKNIIGITTLITLIKSLGCFLSELILDFSNISFMRSEYFARSILIIGFLILVVVSAIVEFLAIKKLSKNDDDI